MGKVLPRQASRSAQSELKALVRPEQVVTAEMVETLMEQPSGITEDSDVAMLPAVAAQVTSLPVPATVLMELLREEHIVEAWRRRSAGEARAFSSRRRPELAQEVRPVQSALMAEPSPEQVVTLEKALVLSEGQ